MSEKQWTSKQIKELRKKLHVTQARFGAILNVSQNYVYMLEKGIRKPSKSLQYHLNQIKSAATDQGSIKLYKFDLNGIKDKLSTEEKKLFIGLGNFYNEIHILLTAYFSSKKENNEEVENIAKLTQRLFFVEMLAGTLVEGWKMFKRNYYGSSLSRRYDKVLSHEDKVKLLKLKKYFDNPNLIKKVRDKYAYHYDQQIENELVAKFDSIKREDLIMFLSNRTGNCFFYFSELLLLQSLAEGGDPVKVIKKLEKETRDMAVCFIESVFSIFNAVLKEHGYETAPEQIEILNAPPIKDLDLPYFISHDTGK